MPDKVLFVKESSRSTNGVRTVIHSVLAAGTTIPSHIHTQYDEILEILEGEMKVIESGKETVLTAGQTIRVEKGKVHHYVTGSRDVIANIILEPGHEGFEKAIQIMKAMQADGTYAHLNTMDRDSYLFLSVIGKLTDTIYVDVPEEISELLYSKVDFVVKELTEKYCRQPAA